MKLALILLLFTAKSFGITICPQLDANGLCSLPISEIHPTQHTIGYLNARLKAKRIEKKFKKKGIEGLNEYLDRKYTEFIIGPGNKYYIIDRHHSTKGLFEADIPNEFKYIRGKVKADLSDLSNDEFVKRMQEKKWTYLKDVDFVHKPFTSIPRSINGLNDNPYRSMVSMLIDSGNLNKVGIPFEEFYWAEFFYNNGLRLEDGEKSTLLGARSRFKDFLNEPKAIDFANKIKGSCGGHFTPMRTN